MLQAIDLPNLLNGVSRQPFNLRLASQGEEQVNASSDVVKGLRKRPGLSHLVGLSGAAAGAVFHLIDRDPDRRFLVAVTSGAIRAWNLNTGAPATINNAVGTSYLTFTGHAHDAMRFLTVADYTFLVNTQKVPAMASANTGRPNYSAMIYLKTVQASSWHEVFIDGVQRARSASNNVGDAATLTDALVAALDTSLNANWIVRDLGSNVIYIERLGGVDFSIRINGGNSDIKVIKETVQDFSYLPARGQDGVKINVIGNSGNNFDDYWVKYDSNNDTESGVWRESNAHNLTTTIDKATMPHALVIDSNGTSLTFRQLDWGERNVGDAESNPEPSFIGTPINDVFFYRNRLGFVADENVLLSEAGEFFNFFATTVTDLLDSDPIDVATSHTRVSVLKRAIPVSERLVLLSDKVQFFDNVSGDDLLTPKTAAFKAKSEYDSYIGPTNATVAKTTLFIPQRNKEWSRLWEMIPDADKNPGQELAIDVTEHVPDYLPDDMRRIVYHQGSSSLYMHSDFQPNRLYVYRWLVQDNKRAQASWSYWEFDDESLGIVDFFVVDNKMYIVRLGTSTTDYRLGYIDLENQADYTDGTYEFHVHLDNKVELTGSYDAANDWTTWTLPLQWPTTVPFTVIRGPGFTSGAGTVIQSAYRSSTTQVRAIGDHSEDTCILGVPFEFLYEFSRFYVRDEQGQAQEDGRTVCKAMTLYLKDTGYLKAIVSRTGQEDRDYEFSGLSIGSPLGAPAMRDGAFRVPIHSRNENIQVQLRSEDPYPLQVTKARLVVDYTNNDRSV
jgi:hypothetical protein